MGIRRRRWAFVVAVLVGSLLLPLLGGSDVRADRLGLTDVSVQQSQVNERGSDPALDQADALAQKHDKMDGSTALMANSAAGRTGLNPAAVAEARSLAVADGGRLRVVVESAGNRAGAVSAVNAVGGVVEAEYVDLVQALVAPNMLEALAANPAVRYVRQPAMATPDAVTGEEVGASGASVWQAAGTTGVGVKVGVIDVGFTGYQQRQASGDLPNNLIVQDFCNGQVNVAGLEHGTAVAEIVYEMAPGIQLYLLCIGTDVQLGQAKDFAKANGIQILTMSLSWFNTSRGDGTGSASSPNATVADARANNILWVNSAGNRAKQHYSANFSDTDSNGNHNFTNADNGNTIFLSTNQQICVYLRWDNWPTTNQDLDLQLQISSSGNTVAQSTTRQTGSQAPVESLCYTNTTGSGQNFAIVVRRFSLTSNPFFDLFVTPGPDLEHQVAAGSVTEPASSPSAFAVAAICWQNNRLEDYSSQGPTIDGRIKPDIAGQSVVSSATYGAFVSCPSNSNGQGGFNGTSAANPTVAGAAALVRSANTTFTATQIQQFLETRATDLGPAGKDNQFGVGRLTLGAAPSGPITCTPRPPVTLTTTKANGRLAVIVQVTGTNNTLQSVQFSNGARVPTNALLDLEDGRTGQTGAVTWTATNANATSTTFFLRRQVAGQAVTVPFTVTDRCGTWTTFVGGGTGTTGF